MIPVYQRSRWGQRSRLLFAVLHFVEDQVEVVVSQLLSRIYLLSFSSALVLLS